MHPKLPIGEYLFSFQAHNDLTLPGYSSVLWRSVFGRALKQLVCVTGMKQCNQCMFLHQCDYPHLFRGPRPPNSVLMRKYATIPVPHIFRSQTSAETIVRAKQRFSVGIILTGSANDKLSLVYRAMYAAGIAGLGKQRVQCQLVDIVQTGPQQQTSQLLSAGSIDTQAQPGCPTIPNFPGKIRLELITPYKSSGKGREQTLNLSRLIMAVIPHPECLCTLQAIQYQANLL